MAARRVAELAYGEMITELLQDDLIGDLVHEPA